jgi:CRP-like cAMP-binding protein
MKNDSIVRCLDCQVSCKSIFKDTDKNSDLVKLDRKVQIYSKGEPIYLEGTSATGVYCVRRGSVKVFKTQYDGSEIIFHLASEGDLIGHSSLSITEHMNSAVAVEETRCCFFEKSFFLSLVKKEPMLLLLAFNKVEEELSEAQGKNIGLIKLSVRERLACYFVRMAELYGQAGFDGIKINLRLSREEIAAYVGTAQETAIRFISEFKAKGIIKEERRQFYVMRLEELKQAAGKQGYNSFI